MKLTKKRRKYNLIYNILAKYRYSEVFGTLSFFPIIQYRKFAFGRTLSVFLRWFFNQFLIVKQDMKIFKL